MRLEWNEEKRQSNLRKHGLDFAHAAEVLESVYRMDVHRVRESELRIQSFSYVLDQSAVLTLVHTDRNEAVRIISYRPASKLESEVYFDWIGKNPR